MNNKFSWLALVVALIFFSKVFASDKEFFGETNRSSGKHFKVTPAECTSLHLKVVEKSTNKKPFQGKRFRIIAGSASAELETAKATIASLKDRIAYLEMVVGDWEREKSLLGVLKNKEDILGVDWKSNEDNQKREISRIYREELKKQRFPFSDTTKKISPQGKRAEHLDD